MKNKITIIGAGSMGSVALATALAIHGLGVIVAEEKNVFKPEPEVFTITARPELPEYDLELIKKEAEKHPFEKFIGKPKRL